MLNKNADTIPIIDDFKIIDFNFKFRIIILIAKTSRNFEPIYINVVGSEKIVNI